MEKKSFQSSLSKKLDGGYLHVKQHKQPKQPKPKQGGYSMYLKKMKGGVTPEPVASKASTSNSKKIVSIQMKKLSPKKRNKKS